jgi:hypothetical protein
MQAPAHSFIPDGQVPPHDVPSQVAVPPVGTLHAVQDDPHEVTAVLRTHDVPHAWYPVAQVNPHDVPSHVAVPLAGAVHGVHDVPQLFGLALGWQLPEQSWLPATHTPEQEAVLAMQAPAHSFIPVGQAPPHVVPSQVAVPPVGIGQATHAMPQFATSVFFTQVPVQSWEPARQPVLPPASPASLASLARSVPPSTMTWPPVPPPVPPPSVPPAPRGTSRERAEVQPVAPVAIAAATMVNPSIRLPR